MTREIVSVDEVCTAVQGILTAHLTDTMTRLGFTVTKPVRTWSQVPTMAAIVAATLPAGAVVSPGLVEPPRRTSSGHEATWRIPAGLYVRGREHDDTAALVRDWCAGIRICVLQHRSLGGIAKALTWVGEDYRLVTDRASARTIAGGTVSFDVTVAMQGANAGIVLPPVTSTPTSVSVQ